MSTWILTQDNFDAMANEGPNLVAIDEVWQETLSEIQQNNTQLADRPSQPSVSN
jgi:hypothetical protein